MLSYFIVTNFLPQFLTHSLVWPLPISQTSSLVSLAFLHPHKTFLLLLTCYNCISSLTPLPPFPLLGIICLWVITWLVHSYPLCFSSDGISSKRRSLTLHNCYDLKHPFCFSHPSSCTSLSCNPIHNHFHYHIVHLLIYFSFFIFCQMKFTTHKDGSLICGLLRCLQQDVIHERPKTIFFFFANWMNEGKVMPCFFSY